MMRKTNEGTYDQIIKVVAEHLENEGFRKIYANTDGFDQPERVKWESGDKGVLPDMLAKARDKTYVFEVEDTEVSLDEDLVDRWRLLSAHARRNGGDLYLIVPQDNVSKVRSSLTESNVSAQILPVTGV
jgi:hypothetical protein